MRNVWKWMRGHYRTVKAVYYKKEVLVVRLIDAIPDNYSIAKNIFEGCFGHCTYECSELMITYKAISRRLDDAEYTKINNSISHLGFSLIVSSNGTNTVVGIIPETNLQRYITDKALGTQKVNIESLSYLT